MLGGRLGEEIAKAARMLVGTRFRPQGRDPVHGLDCIGLAYVALRQAGVRIDVPRDYPLRGGNLASVLAIADAAGLRCLPINKITIGDVVLMSTGPAQLHAAVLTDTGFVHADASLRRVVEKPGWPNWPILSAWRAEQGEN